MMSALKRGLAQFHQREDGNMTIEFLVFIPLLFTIFLTSIELGIYQMRQMFLDRGMDMAVREVRLNTGANFSHATLKTSICNYAGFLEDCETQLKLELRPVDIRTFQQLNAQADCTDASQPVTPNRAFVLGGQHEVMLMRACYKFKPIFASTGLGYSLAENGDSAGMAQMISLSAFVQEP
ncbi:MAG: TadE/TadG family type IV pilus assembly protein [Paracoccaceae bacterium]